MDFLEHFFVLLLGFLSFLKNVKKPQVIIKAFMIIFVLLNKRKNKTKSTYFDNFSIYYNDFELIEISFFPNSILFFE